MSDETKPPVRHCFMFIGDSISDLPCKSKRFVIESPAPDRPGCRLKGKVIARAKNAIYHLGHESDTWASPIQDTTENLFPSFVRIPAHMIDELFEIKL